MSAMSTGATGRRPARRTTVTTVLVAVVAALLATVAPVSAQEELSVIPARAAAADAFGFEYDQDLLGNDVLHIQPEPFLSVTASDAMMPSARDSVLDAGPVGDGPSAGEANVAEITVEADIIAPAARATAVTTDVNLLQPAVGDAHIVTADAIAAVSTTTCTEQTLEEAAAGTALTGLTIAGEAIPVDVPFNTEIEIPNLARVTIKEVVPDSDGIGWTVRGLHIRTLDPLTGAVDSEIIVSEAHSTVDCGGVPTGCPPECPPTDGLSVKKSILDATPGEDGTVAVEPGDSVTYVIDVTNVDEAACTVNRIVDFLPLPLSADGTGEVLADVEATPRGENGLVYEIEPVTLEPGDSLTGTITSVLPDPLASGSYFNDAVAYGTCGIGRSGLSAGFTWDGGETDPCDSPITTGTFSSTSRLGGDDRVDTALRVSGMLSVDEANAVVMARSDKFPDALAASGLAAELCAPLLLNPPEELRTENLEEIQRLKVDDVYLAGGEAALSASIADDIEAAGFNVIRVAGDSRYTTARAIAFEIVRIGGPVARATLVRADIFPDAMSAANLATHARSPILLTDSDDLNDASAAALPAILDGEAGNTVYIGGGEVAIEASVEDELNRAYRTRRLAGLNRFETSVAFIEEAVALGAIRDITWVASGHDFPDALTGSVGAFRQDAGLMLTNPNDLADSPATKTYLSGFAEQITTAVIVGGPAAVSEQVEGQILDAIRE